jgi:hypothetical protein
VVYGFGRIDASGRVADRVTIAALGWRGGDRLTLTADAGVMIARRERGILLHPPQVKESPAAEAVPVDRGGDVPDLVPAEQVPPYQAAGQISAWTAPSFLEGVTSGKVGTHDITETASC